MITACEYVHRAENNVPPADKRAKKLLGDGAIESGNVFNFQGSKLFRDVFPTDSKLSQKNTKVVFRAIMYFNCLVAAILGLYLQVQTKTVFFIRHAEKAQDGDSLSTLGLRRADCIANTVFKIQFAVPDRIIAQGDHSHHSQDTLEPLSRSTGIDLELKCGRDEISCAHDLILKNKDHGAIVVAWEHKRLADIANSFLDLPNLNYPGDRYDLVWKIDTEKGTVVELTEDCHL